MKDERLIAALDRAAPGVHMGTWSEIKDYYQDQHAAHRWIGALTTELTGLTPADKRAYSSARRRIERWADGTNKPGKASQTALVELGKRLPPKSRQLPPDGLTFHIAGTFYVSKRDGRRHRDIEVHMDELRALQFVENPSYEAIFEEYGVDGDMFAGGMESDVSINIA